MNVLVHYGTPRHSGRYPYGSGKRPYQSDSFTIGSKKISDIGKHYFYTDKNGKIISELKTFDYGMKNFDWVLIADVETSKEYRRRGLSGKIIDQAYSDLLKNNTEKGFYLFVKSDNVPAINLYDKKGFNKTKEYVIDDKVYYIMTKGNADTSQFKKMKFS